MFGSWIGGFFRPDFAFCFPHTYTLVITGVDCTSAALKKIAKCIHRTNKCFLTKRQLKCLEMSRNVSSCQYMSSQLQLTTVYCHLLDGDAMECVWWWRVAHNFFHAGVSRMLSWLSKPVWGSMCVTVRIMHACTQLLDPFLRRMCTYACGVMGNRRKTTRRKHEVRHANHRMHRPHVGLCRSSYACACVYACMLWMCVYVNVYLHVGRYFRLIACIYVCTHVCWVLVSEWPKQVGPTRIRTGIDSESWVLTATP